MSYIDQYIPQCRQFEGVIPFMYRDAAGLCTVGVGNMLPNVAAAVQLPFKTPSGVLATPEEIGEDYDRVMAMPVGSAARAYKSASSLVLDDSDVDVLLAKRLQEFDGQLTIFYLGFEWFPDTAKMALLDLLFNLGFGGLKKYVLMGDSVRRKDWASAANQCARNSHNPAFNSRNEWCKSQFLAAV